MLSLNDRPIDELLWELRRREGSTRSGPTTAGSPVVKELADVNTGDLVSAVKDRQKVIYGVDDRVDLYHVADGRVLQDAESVVALFPSASVVDNGDGTSTLITQNFGTSNNLCATEPFRNQPVGAFCSGFLVGRDLVATAGHCVDANSLPNVRFVFGFRMTDANTAPNEVNNSDVFRGVELVGRELSANGTDWSLVRLDRPPDYPPVRFRTAGRVGHTNPLHVIGHPSGLPTKYAPGAEVRDNAPDAFFVANLDTYGGNSGSPVFHRDTHQVEGVLVRGETDFTMQGACLVSLVCPSTGCRGEDCTRTTEFAPLIGGYPVGFARHSRQVLDVRQASIQPGAGLIQWPFHGADNQRFRFEPVGGGFSRIVMSHSGKVLDVFGGSTQSGAKVIQWDWHGGDNQRFLVEPVGGGFSRIVAKHSGKVFDVSGASSGAGAEIIQWDWHGGDNQRWSLGSAPVFVRHSGHALDIHSASTASGAALIQWPFHGMDNQLFTAERLGNGFYRIVVQHSGKVLDVAGASTTSGANVIQWDWHGGDNQLFVLQPVGGGFCRITAKHSGKVLDVRGASAVGGAEVIQWDWHSGDNQRWRMNVA